MFKSFRFPNLIFFYYCYRLQFLKENLLIFKKLGFIFSISGIILFLILFLEYLFFLFEESILYFRLFSSHNFLIVFFLIQLEVSLRTKYVLLS